MIFLMLLFCDGGTMICNKFSVTWFRPYLAFLFVAGILAGCAGTAPRVKKPVVDEEAKKKAIEFFIEGKVAESKKNFGDAATSCLEALNYDTESAEITLSLAGALIRKEKYRTALSYARRAVQLDPENLDAWRMLQWLEQHENNIKEAIEALQMYIKLSPEKDFNNIAKLAFFYFSLDENTKAKEVLLSYIQDKRTPANDMEQAAKLLESKGMTEEAASIYNRIIERDPTDVSAWLSLGILFSQNGQEDEAGMTFKEALEKNPDSDDLKIAIGNHCLAKYDWECAINYYEQAIVGSDKGKEIQKTLCAVYFYAGRDNDAISLVNTLKEQGDDDSFFYFSLGKSMRFLKRYEEAVTYYRTGLSKIDKTIPEKIITSAYNSLAQTLIKLGREEEAINLIHTEAKATIKDVATIKLLESNVYYELKRYDDAAAILEWLSSSDPENISFYIRLSLVYDASGRFKDAEKALLDVLKLEPDHALATNNLAYIYMEHDVNIKKAIKMVKQALLTEPDNGAYHDTLGWGYFKLGKYKEARKYIESALKLADKQDKGVIFEHHGDILSKLGKNKEAAEAYKKSIEYGEDIERIQPKLDTLDVE